MVFSSSIFLFAFLPIFLVVYIAVVSRPARNIVLLAFSLVFYAWGEPIYVWLMVASILVNWALGYAISRTRKEGDEGAQEGAEEKGEESIREGEEEAPRNLMPKLLLVLDVAFNIAVLGFFKYWGFLAENINIVLGEAYIADPGLSLPIGISFFTLQALSYVIDVYRGQVKAQANPLYLGMYIAMFPQLVAGPIVRYSQIEEAIRTRRMTLAGAAQGLRLFAVGLGKKVLLANTAGILADSMLAQSAPEIGFVGCFSGVAAYTFQIYFDFSGYSDMAIGLGKIMGFDYTRNFNYPYTSRSATEFWRRWHMSLGSFFRDYVYIPMGGSRVSKSRWMLNILVVWALTGIWHGAAWNFLLWGLYWGFWLMLEKLFLLRALARLPRVVSHIYCIVLFFFGWLLFAVTGLDNVGQWFCGMFGAYGLTGAQSFWELQAWSYVSLIPVAVVAALPVGPWLRKRIQAWVDQKPCEGPAAPEKGNDGVPTCQIDVSSAASAAKARGGIAANCAFDVFLVAVFVLSCISIASSSYNPFIYFQF